MKLVKAGICTLMVLGSALGVTTTAEAQQRNGGAAIAYVNSQLILQQTPGYAAAESTFTKELATFRAEMQKLQATLDSAASEFEQQSVLLSPTQRTARRKELQEQQAELAQRAAELEQRAAARERELLDPINSKINSVIEGIRAAGNYAIVFDISAPGNGIIAADKSLDLTQRVIAQLKSGS